MKQFLFAAGACFDMCFPAEPRCATLCSGSLSLCVGAAFGASFEHQRASCPCLLVLLSHYWSPVEGRGFPKGETAEKLKTQECCFCGACKGLFQPFRVLWLEIRFDTGEQTQLSISPVFRHPLHFCMGCTQNSTGIRDRIDLSE